MARKVNISPEEVVGIITPLRDSSVEWMEELSQRRQDSVDLYKGKTPEAEREGFSGVVDTIAYNAVESLKPNISAVFTGDWFNLMSDHEKRGDKFKKLIRHYFYVKQNGKRKVKDAIHDALVYYFFIAKNYYKVDYDIKTERFDSLTEEEFIALSNTPNVIVSKYKEVVAENDDTMRWLAGDAPLYVRRYENVKAMYKIVKYRGPWTDIVPPWEFYYVPGYPNLDDCPFVMHRVKRTLDYVRRMERAGEYKKGSYEKLKDKVDNTQEDSAVTGEIFQQYENEDLSSPDDSPADIHTNKLVLSNNEVWIDECWLKIDIDKDGFLEPCKVVLCHDVVVCEPEENPYGKPPFVLGYYNKEPHKMESTPLPLLLEDEQKEMTNLRRIMTDSAAEACYTTMITDDPLLQRQWTERYIGDSLRGRPNTYEVREGRSPSMFPLRVYEKTEEEIERKTGITSYTQGLDNNALNKTATGVNLIMGAAQMRMKFIAENLSEAFEEIIRQYILILQKWPSQDQVVVAGEPIQIHEDDLRAEYDIEVDVGVGPQERQAAAMAMEELIQFILGAGIPNGIATPLHLVKAVMRKYKMMNINVRDLVKDESDVERMLQDQGAMQRLTAMIQQMAAQGVPPEQAGQMVLQEIVKMSGGQGNGGTNQAQRGGPGVPQAA